MDWHEISCECPKCGDRFHWEFDFSSGDKSIDAFYVQTKKEFVECNECEHTFWVSASGEVAVEYSEAGAYVPQPAEGGEG